MHNLDAAILGDNYSSLKETWILESLMIKEVTFKMDDLKPHFPVTHLVTWIPPGVFWGQNPDVGQVNEYITIVTIRHGF